MAIIVEDGTGKADANSYVTLAVADAYFALRGLSEWAGPDTEKEVQTLTIASECTDDGDLTITLNAVAFTVAITTAADTAAKVATAIRAVTYAGWVITGADADIIFTADKAETRAGAYTLAVGATGVTGTYAQTQTGSAASKEAALIRATGAIDGMYATKWPGTRSTQDQALAWPRTGAWDTEGFPLADVPLSVAHATCEAALYELLEPGALTPSLDRGGAIIREKVGPIETQYATGASSVTIYSTIRNALARIVPVGGAMIFRRG